MARIETIVVRASDLSGETGAQEHNVKTLTFKVPGFKLDLTPAEIEDVTARIEELQSAVSDLVSETLGEYLNAYNALAAAGASTSGGAAEKAPTSDTGTIRQWARANGYTVGDRGRLSPEIVSAFKRANASKVTDLDTTTRGGWDNSEAGDGDVYDVEPTDAELDALEPETV